MFLLHKMSFFFFFSHDVDDKGSSPENAEWKTAGV